MEETHPTREVEDAVAALGLPDPAFGRLWPQELDLDHQPSMHATSRRNIYHPVDVFAAVTCLPFQLRQGEDDHLP